MTISGNITSGSLSLSKSLSQTKEKIYLSTPRVTKERSQQIDEIKAFLNGKFLPEVSQQIYDVWSGKEIGIVFSIPTLKKRKWKRIPSGLISPGDKIYQENIEKKYVIKPHIYRKKDDHKLCIYFCADPIYIKDPKNGPIDCGPKSAIKQPTLQNSKFWFRNLIDRIVSFAIDLFQKLKSFCSLNWVNRITKNEEAPKANPNHALNISTTDILGIDSENCTEILPNATEILPDEDESTSSDSSDDDVSLRSSEPIILEGRPDPEDDASDDIFAGSDSDVSIDGEE